jgi:hypothetical protein
VDLSERYADITIEGNFVVLTRRADGAQILLRESFVRGSPASRHEAIEHLMDRGRDLGFIVRFEDL